MGFVFVSCESGYQDFVKEDVARDRAALRLAYSHPGVITFKIDDEVPPEVERPSPWAHVWGQSLGRAQDVTSALALVPPDARRLHVWAHRNNSTGESVEVEPIERALREAAGGRFVDGERALDGELVADVILFPGRQWLVGVHRHGLGRSPHPGGALPVDVPADSPSRAYAKIEQAIAWAGLPVAAGHVAVEVGSAPGGAAFALARRGVTVWGVDPGDMDPGVLAFEGPAGARVHHLRETLASVRWEMLPRAADWLVLDVNLAPPVAIHGLARLVPAWKKKLRGAVLTLKMNDAAIRRGVPTWLERIAALGFDDVRVTHLPSNHAELCVIARR